MPGTRTPTHDLIGLAQEYISHAETLFFAIRKASDPHSTAHGLASVGMDYLNGAEATLEAELARAMEWRR